MVTVVLVTSAERGAGRVGERQDRGLVPFDEVVGLDRERERLRRAVALAPRQRSARVLVVDAGRRRTARDPVVDRRRAVGADRALDRQRDGRRRAVELRDGCGRGRRRRSRPDRPHCSRSASRRRTPARARQRRVPQSMCVDAPAPLPCPPRSRDRPVTAQLLNPTAARPRSAVDGRQTSGIVSRCPFGPIRAHRSLCVTRVTAR